MLIGLRLNADYSRGNGTSLVAPLHRYKPTNIIDKFIIHSLYLFSLYFLAGTLQGNGGVDRDGTVNGVYHRLWFGLFQ